MGAGERAERAVVLDQPLAPALDAVKARGLPGRDPVPRLELLADRLGIDRAHQAPDILQLAPPRLVPGDAPRLLHGLAQVLRKRDRRELLRVELHQARPERLQLVHGALALGLARFLLVLHVRGGAILN